MSFKYYEDPILGKGRALVTGGTGGGGTEYVGGNRINIAGGTISFVNSADIVNVTGTSVTLQPNTAYKIYATSQAITLNANPPAAGKWAYEGHLEIFTAGTGYIVTGSNVVLANALEPDAVNNCTVRFHDGIAIIAVEDHVAGYIVVNGSTSGDGSLYYGITTSTNDYVAFDASLNGTTIPLAGAVAEGEKHLVGNGYTETAITGAVDCGSSKFTVANLGLNNVQITGGVMTFGDAFIPSGSTVAVSGGGLAVEKVTGAGSESVIDLGGTFVNVKSASASDCTFTSGVNNYGGAFYVSNFLSLNKCTVSGNSASTVGGGIQLRGASQASGFLSSCIVSGNSNANVPDDIVMGSSTLLKLNGGNTVGVILDAGQVVFEGENRIDKIIHSYGLTSGNGSVTLTSGAILDLTGNTNATPIAPGGGITFESGGATVKVGYATASSSYMMDNVTLSAGAKLTNTAVVDLNSTHVVIPSGATASATGCIISGGSASYGGAFDVAGSMTLTSCTVTGNFASVIGGGFSLTGKCDLDKCNSTDGAILWGSSELHISDTVFRFAQLQDVGTKFFIDGNCTISEKVVGKNGASSTGGTVTISSGATLDLTGNTNATPIAPGGGVIVDGGCTVINSAGASVSIAGGTYTRINNDGTTE